MGLERERAPKREVFLERLGVFSWSEWQAQSDEGANAKIHELIRRRRLTIEFFDLVSDDGEVVAALDKEGNFRYFHAIGGGPFYLELTGPEENLSAAFFLRYYSLHAATA